MRFLFVALLVYGSSALATNQELKLACKAASFKFPTGSGATIYYPNGKVLTSHAGRPGANWYYQNGRILTSNMGVPGASFYYANSQPLSSNFGVAGATWYYSNGAIITSHAPELSVREMLEIACDLIMAEEGNE